MLLWLVVELPNAYVDCGRGRRGGRVCVEFKFAVKAEVAPPPLLPPVDVKGKSCAKAGDGKLLTSASVPRHTFTCSHGRVRRCGETAGCQAFPHLASAGPERHRRRLTGTRLRGRLVDTTLSRRAATLEVPRPQSSFGRRGWARGPAPASAGGQHGPEAVWTRRMADRETRHQDATVLEKTPPRRGRQHRSDRRRRADHPRRR